ncbi:hypothetical protein C8R43DRAFT_991705 [Mycena crocata]|nr:hypothetical protein C8R43DRAFT_991705 [Mycena crocata]
MGWEVSLPFHVLGLKSYLMKFLKYRSKFKFTVSNFKFTSAEVELVDGQLDFAAGVGVIFSLTYKDKIAERNIFEIGLSPLQIPGIIVLGPMLTMDTGVGYEVSGFQSEGKFLARTNFGWSNMTAKLDMVGDTSYLGEWVPIVPRPLVSAELKGKATLDPYISAGLLFGVSILKGKFKARTGVEVRASLPVTASVAVSGSSDNDVTLNGDCRGITIELAAKLEIYLTVDITKYNRHYGIQDITVPVFSHCIPIPTAMQMDKLAPDVLPPIYIPANNHTKYVSITAEIGRRGIMQIIWLPWPIDTIAIVPPVGANVSAQAILSRLFLSSTTVPDTNGTVGAYDGRLLHFNGNDMAAFGVARLQLSRPDSISKSSVLVAFRSERGKNGKPAFVGGVTTASTTKLSTYYYPIVCLYSPGHYSGQKFQPATLFLATDPKAAPKAITDQNVVDKLNYPYQYPDINLLGGPRVEYCQFAPFTITQT